MECRSLEDRVLRLERANKALLSALVAVVGGAVIFGFQTKPDEIVDVLKARALVLYSPDNKVIVQSGLDSWTAGGRIGLFDKNGERKSWWRASPRGSHLYLSSGLKEGEGDLETDDYAVVLSASPAHAGASIFGKDAMIWSQARDGQDPEVSVYGKGEQPIFTTRKGK